eukprot:11255771-Heterocapsa_arctica.AAC.1
MLLQAYGKLARQESQSRKQGKLREVNIQLSQRQPSRRVGGKQVRTARQPGRQVERARPGSPGKTQSNGNMTAATEVASCPAPVGAAPPDRSDVRPIRSGRLPSCAPRGSRRLCAALSSQHQHNTYY